VKIPDPADKKTRGIPGEFENCASENIDTFTVRGNPEG
jgi:hypothetical protein